MKFKVLSAAIAALLSPYTFAETAEIDLPAMVVSADFRPSLAQETPISLTTFDSELIESRGAQHIEDILNLAPNVNVSSGASRSQYFQIRGIGERSQFKSPINPSVGLYIDGIDFSRTGGAATLFDIEQVEILRGPQGTIYGANALAGVINLQSKQPTDELDIHIETGIAEYNSHNVGIAVGGPLIDDKLLGRMSIYSHQSDGYMENDFLNRDDTQNRDEITARGQLKWLVSEDLTIDLNILHLNIDNGYDAFTFDNSRHSVADEPGKDKQRTNAFALKTDWRASDKVQIQTTLTYSQSDLEYSYDDDWSYKSQYYDPNPVCLDSDYTNDVASCLYPYSGFDQYKRERENYSFEMRLLSNEDGNIFNNSTSWSIGLYHANQSEDLNKTYFANNFIDNIPDVSLYNNQYNTLNTAIFGQLDTKLSEKLSLITGLRVENWQADYSDVEGLDLEDDDVLFGGKLGLNYQVSNDHMLFTTLSRGYKAGGVNTEPALPGSLRSFDAESLWNMDAGIKSSWLDGDLITNITAFYTLRKDAQVKSSIQDPRDSGGTDFLDYLVNAEKVSNVGIEADFNWLINSKWRAFASVGLLNAVLDDYENPELLSNGITLSGRRIAHAPAYQFSFGGEYYFAQNWTFRANLEGKDEFYFSNSHNAKSSSYALVNSSLDYTKGDWKVSLWGRNLFDKDYDTRGFFWGIDPGTGYEDRKYTQKGDPRVVGINVSWDY